jgi:hypothetical protein
MRQDSNTFRLSFFVLSYTFKLDMSLAFLRILGFSSYQEFHSQTLAFFSPSTSPASTPDVFDPVFLGADPHSTAVPGNEPVSSHL